jgi:hypothetical protein
VDVEPVSKPLRLPAWFNLGDGRVVWAEKIETLPTLRLFKEMYMPIGMEEIENWFTYHQPTEVDQVAFVAIRNAAKELAKVIVNCTPPSADQTAALRKVREAVMTANAAIACQGK